MRDHSYLRVKDLPNSYHGIPGIGFRGYMAEIRAGRLQACQVGGRKTWVTSLRWIREWIENLESVQQQVQVQVQAQEQRTAKCLLRRHR